MFGGRCVLWLVFVLWWLCVLCVAFYAFFEHYLAKRHVDERTKFWCLTLNHFGFVKISLARYVDARGGALRVYSIGVRGTTVIQAPESGAYCLQCGPVCGVARSWSERWRKSDDISGPWQ